MPVSMQPDICTHKQAQYGATDAKESGRALSIGAPSMRRELCSHKYRRKMEQQNPKNVMKGSLNWRRVYVVRDLFSNIGAKCSQLCLGVRKVSLNLAPYQCSSRFFHNYWRDKWSTGIFEY